MDIVRWGLLSTANINRRLITPIQASPRGRLQAVASRSLASAQAYAKRWKIPLAFGSYEAMLESDQVDAVYIGLPNHLHAEWSIRAMQAGKHVLCEKPLATSLEEVDRMEAASRQTGKGLMEAFMYRHHPQTRLAGEWVRSGRLGEVRLVRAVFNFYMGKRHNERGDLNIRLVPEYGGGSLWDVGVYPISLAQYIYGEPPQWVSATQWIGESGVDEFFAGLLGYPGGAAAQVACSFRTPFYTYAEVLGTHGRLELNRPFIGMELGRQLLFYPPTGDPEEIPVPEQELYAGEVENLQAHILDGADLYLTLAESRQHVRTALALYAAARTGQVTFL
jgi:predicted dehydrogenase